MARIGLYSSLIVVAFGVVAPFFIFKLGRSIGLAPLLALGFLIGLGYGALKAEYPWDEQGSLGNAMFMAASRYRLGRLRCAELWRGELYQPNGVIASQAVGACTPLLRLRPALRGKRGFPFAIPLAPAARRAASRPRPAQRRSSSASSRAISGSRQYDIDFGLPFIT
jgi:hypothetical protein